MQLPLQSLLTRLVAPRCIAYAHSGTTSYVNVAIRDHTITGEVQYPIQDLNHVLELSIPRKRLAGMAAMKDRPCCHRGVHERALRLG